MPNSTDLQTIIDRLGAISGQEHLHIENGDVSISPANTEEVAGTLRYASEIGMSVTPYGGGTKRSWCNPICRPMLILKMHRLSMVREHTWQDMTCTVEAGCIWSSMQSALAVHGQFVALDPLWPDCASIGGVVATNDSGCLRLRYGSLRDLIIGMTIVLADGTIARSGGKVVKNVAGYDLHKLMTGAFGTLGIITEVTFRLHSMPKYSRSFTVASHEVETLGKLLLKILDSHLSTESLQLRSSNDGFNLDVRLAALPQIIDDQAASLATLAKSLNLLTSCSDVDVWRVRQKYFDQPGHFVFKATMFPVEISPIVAAVHAIGGISVTQAIGVMIASIPVDAFSQLSHLRQRVEVSGGYLTVLHAPEHSAVERWGTLPDTLPLMRKIKDLFDPNRILNPRCFLGGI